MLIRRCMVDDGGPVLDENVVKARTVLHVPDLGVEGDLREPLFHFAIDLEQWRLGDFKSHDSSGLKARNLPAKLGSNGSRGPGHENDFALEHFANSANFKPDRVAAKEIFDCYFTNLANQAALFDHLSESGHGLRLHTRGMAQLQDPSHLHARGRGNGNQNDRYIVLGYK